MKLTVAEWARRLKISRQAGHAAVRRLGIEVIDGKLHAAKASAVYAAMTRQRVRKSAAAVEPSGQVTYTEARRREAVARAVMLEREALLQAGTLIQRDAIVVAEARKVGAVRESLLSVPHRLSALLVGRAEPEIFSVLIDEMHLVLGHLSAPRAQPGGKAE